MWIDILNIYDLKITKIHLNHINILCRVKIHTNNWPRVYWVTVHCFLYSVVWTGQGLSWNRDITFTVLLVNDDPSPLDLLTHQN